jgi:hypothetical protein
MDIATARYKILKVIPDLKVDSYMKIREKYIPEEIYKLGWKGRRGAG